SIHVPLHIVENLKRDVLDTAEAVGVLFGHIVPGEFRSTVVVEDYELVDAATSVFAKETQLADAVSRRSKQCREQRAIGVFRSQRTGSLALSDDDLTIARSLFADIDNIFLLMRTGPGAERGAFFFWEG